jgi:hypothetical protein
MAGLRSNLAVSQVPKYVPSTIKPTAMSNRDPASNVSPSAMGRVFQTERVSRTR